MRLLVLIVEKGFLFSIKLAALRNRFIIHYIEATKLLFLIINLYLEPSGCTSLNNVIPFANDEPLHTQKQFKQPLIYFFKVCRYHSWREEI